MFTTTADKSGVSFKIPSLQLLLTLTLSLTVVGSLSAPMSSGVEGQEKLMSIIKSVAEQKNDGSYFFAYEGADGSYREEVGIVKRSNDVHNNQDDADDVDSQTELEVSGVYRYTDSNGERVEVSYVADKNGFVPVGSNIPKQITEAARSADQSLEVRVVKNN